jgi:methanogenic corrinoid protein MtbC1
MKSAMVLLRPRLAASGQKMPVRAIIGTVKGDLHDIGLTYLGGVVFPEVNFTLQ